MNRPTVRFGYSKQIIYIKLSDCYVKKSGYNDYPLLTSILFWIFLLVLDLLCASALYELTLYTGSRLKRVRLQRALGYSKLIIYIKSDCYVKKSVTTTTTFNEHILLHLFTRFRSEKKLWIGTLFCGCAVVYAARTAMPLCALAIATEFNWNKKQSVSACTLQQRP